MKQPAPTQPRLPKVVIVGRPNVGKSSLLNLLSGRLVSIVDPTAGVTRDRVGSVVELPPVIRGDPTRFVELIDTGGIGIVDSQDLSADVERQIAVGLAEADLVLFVVDAQEGVVTLDKEVAKLLREGRPTRPGKRPAPVFVIANKVDGPSHDASAYDAASLGFGLPIGLSASNGYHKEELYQLLREKVDFDAVGGGEAAPDPGVLLAIVGKRNAGKSTFVNMLAGEERVIVSEQEGTTRDSIDVRFQIDDRVFTAIDTAGVRKTKSLQGDIEYYSYHRALRSIRRADVVVMLIDAAVPVSQVDKQLGHEVLKHYKPTVVVINKWDLAQAKYTQDEYVAYLDDALKGLNFAPIIFTSAINNEGVRDVVAMALNLHQQAGHRVPTAELNRVMEKILIAKSPSSKAGHSPRIYYATQLAVYPPTVGLFVNDPSMFDPSYQRFLINRFRESLPYSEVPIRIVIRGKRAMPSEREAS